MDHREQRDAGPEAWKFAFLAIPAAASGGAPSPAQTRWRLAVARDEISFHRDWAKTESMDMKSHTCTLNEPFRGTDFSQINTLSSTT